MRKILLAVIVAFLMTVTIIPMADVSDADDTVTFDGYIKMNGSLLTNDIIEISIYYEQDGIVENMTTKGIENGYFSIDRIPANLAATSYYFGVVINGYQVSGVSRYLDGTPVYIGESTFAYRFNSLPILTNNTYTISTTDAQCINISSTYGIVKGTITTDSSTPMTLNGVKVNIIDEETKVIVVSATTENGGQYMIDRCPTGNYKLQAETSGYETITDYIVVGTGTNTFDYDMKETPGEWLGTDLPHAMMIFAGILGIIVIIVAIIYRIRIRKKKSDVVYDDEMIIE